jgi:hypothetical protein
MKARNRSGSNADTLATAILSSTGALLILGQLDIVSSRLHLSSQPWTEWWPLLLIVSGFVLLLMHRAERSRSLKQDAGNVSTEYGGNQ